MFYYLYAIHYTSQHPWFNSMCSLSKPALNFPQQSDREEKQPCCIYRVSRSKLMLNYLTVTLFNPSGLVIKTCDGGAALSPPRDTRGFGSGLSFAGTVPHPWRARGCCSCPDVLSCSRGPALLQSNRLHTLCCATGEGTARLRGKSPKNRLRPADCLGGSICLFGCCLPALTSCFFSPPTSCGLQCRGSGSVFLPREMRMNGRHPKVLWVMGWLPSSLRRQRELLETFLSGAS